MDEPKPGKWMQVFDDAFILLESESDNSPYKVTSWSNGDDFSSVHVMWWWPTMEGYIIMQLEPQEAHKLGERLLTVVDDDDSV